MTVCFCSFQAVQNKTNCEKAEDDRRDYILEPVSDKTNDSGLVLESFTDSVETSPSVDRDIVSTPSVDPNSCVEAPDSVLSQSSNSINSLLKLGRKYSSPPFLPPSISSRLIP